MSSPLFTQQARSPSGTGRAVYPAPSDRHALPANEYFEPKSEQTMPIVIREPDQRPAETANNDESILTGSYGRLGVDLVRAYSTGPAAAFRFRNGNRRAPFRPRNPMSARL